MSSPLSAPASTDAVIEAIVHSFCDDQSSMQARYIFRESLRNLVRLAKAEQAQEMQAGMTPMTHRDGRHVLH